jgi:hypothetical protein
LNGTRHLLWLAVAAACMVSAPARATDSERRLSLGGFGTIGALYHNEDGLEYRRNINQPRGARAGKLDLATDSLLGLQLNAAWNRELELVTQAVTRLSADNDWQPQLTRAFVRYNPGETLSLRAGRIGWEIYPRADSRNIGYSQSSIRPPVEAFGFIPAEAYDGGDLTLTRPLGDGLLGVQLYGGVTSGKVVRADGTFNDIDGSPVWGGHVDYSFGPWVVRLGSGVFELRNAPDLDALVAGLRQTGQAQALALADTFADKDRRTLFYVAGAAYDEGPLQSRLFLGRTQSDGVAGRNALTGLLTAAYRRDRLTPYGSLAFIHSLREIEETGLPDAPQFAALNAGAHATQAIGYNDQRSLSLGLRYDFRPKLALKFQVDQVWMYGSTLVFEGDRPQSGSDRMTVFGLSLDFIF